MATISIRVDDSLKDDLMHASQELGIPLSSLFTVWAKSFLRTGEITLRVGQNSEDNEMYLNNTLLKQQFEQSVKSGRGTLVL